MKKLTLALLFSVAPAVIFAQTTRFGGRGLLRTLSAETTPRSQLFINGFFSSFLSPTEGASSLSKDHTLSLSVTYGLSRHFELTGHFTAYQDDQAHIWGPPGDSRIGLKAQLPVSDGGFHSALHVFGKFPTARNHNVAFEPFSTDAIGMGMVGVVTFDMTDAFPLFPLKMHLNFGYMDHKLGSNPFGAEEDQYILAGGFKFPIRSAVLYTEYSAEVFTRNQVVNRYSHNSQRVTQGLKLLGPWNVVLDFALDVSLSRDPEVEQLPYLKKYADWKFLFGVTHQMSFKRAKPTREQRQKKIQERIENERLQAVREKRQEMQDELKRMEESLEGGEDKKEKKKKKNDGNL